jgi:hypothetical protein
MVSRRGPKTGDPCQNSCSEDIRLHVIEPPYQTLRNASSEALTSTLPELGSAQQQLLTSSSCAEILTVLLLAKRS